MLVLCSTDALHLQDLCDTFSILVGLNNTYAIRPGCILAFYMRHKRCIYDTNTMLSISYLIVCYDFCRIAKLLVSFDEYYAGCVTFRIGLVMDKFVKSF